MQSQPPAQRVDWHPNLQVLVWRVWLQSEHNMEFPPPHDCKVPFRHSGTQRTQSSTSFPALFLFTALRLSLGVTVACSSHLIGSPSKRSVANWVKFKIISTLSTALGFKQCCFLGLPLLPPLEESGSASTQWFAGWVSATLIPAITSKTPPPMLPPGPCREPTQQRWQKCSHPVLRWEYGKSKVQRVKVEIIVYKCRE